jgi:hypothetical protein
MMREDGMELIGMPRARYLVCTPRSLLKKFERHLPDQSLEEVQPGMEVRLRFTREETEKTLLLCRFRPIVASALFLQTLKRY